MAATIAVKTRYTYSPRTLRYRDNRTGRWAKGRDVKRAVNEAIRNASTEMVRLSRQMAGRRITLAAWQERFAFEIKNLHLASAMAGAGGLANMGPGDYGRVGARLRFEYERLARFAQQLKDRQFTLAQLIDRTKMYVAAGHVSYEAARRDGATAAGFEEERNQLGDAENHCKDKPGQTPGCVKITALGWQRIRTLPPIGSRTCMSRCRCTMRYRRRKRAAAGI